MWIRPEGPAGSGSGAGRLLLGLHKPGTVLMAERTPADSIPVDLSCADPMSGGAARLGRAGASRLRGLLVPALQPFAVRDCALQDGPARVTVLKEPQGDALMADSGREPDTGPLNLRSDREDLPGFSASSSHRTARRRARDRSRSSSQQATAASHLSPRCLHEPLHAIRPAPISALQVALVPPAFCGTALTADESLTQITRPARRGDAFTSRRGGTYGLWVTQSSSAGQRCAQSGGSVSL